MPRAITSLERRMFNAMLVGEPKHQLTSIPIHKYARRVTRTGDYYLFSTKVANFNIARRTLQVINGEAIPDGLGSTQLTKRVLNALVLLSKEHMVFVERVDGWAS